MQLQAYAQDHAKRYDEQITHNQNEIDKLVDRIVDTESPIVIKALEKKITKLEQNTSVLREKRDHRASKTRDFDAQARTAIEFLLSPYKIWENGDTATPRTVLKLAFGPHLEYTRKTGARTTGSPYLFDVIQGLTKGIESKDIDKCQMVRPRR